jgi:hypothetical protein
MTLPQELGEQSESPATVTAGPSVHVTKLASTIAPPLAGAIVAPLALGTAGGAGVGVAGGAGEIVFGQPDTVITGTVPEDENATAHPAGADICKGMVTLTTPGVVAVVVGADAGLVCATTGAAQSKASKNVGLLFIIGSF